MCLGLELGASHEEGRGLGDVLKWQGGLAKDTNVSLRGLPNPSLTFRAFCSPLCQAVQGTVQVCMLPWQPAHFVGVLAIVQREAQRAEGQLVALVVWDNLQASQLHVGEVRGRRVNQGADKACWQEVHQGMHGGPQLVGRAETAGDWHAKASVWSVRTT